MNEQTRGELVGVILAAGFGTRLAPLTDHTPKPLLEVGDVPIAGHLVQRLGRVAGLDRVVVVINNRHPQLFDRWQRALTGSTEVHLVNTGAASVAERNGAVRDMAAAMQAAGGGSEGRRWLVVAGDNLVAESDLMTLDSAGREVGHAVLCRHVGLNPTGRFGEVVVDRDLDITSFREKPAVRRSPIASTCTYSLAGDAPDLIRRYLDVGGDADSPGGFIAWLSERARVRACMVAGDYHDIGTLDHLADARAALDPRE